MKRLKRWWNLKLRSHYFLQWHEAEAKAINAKMRWEYLMRITSILTMLAACTGCFMTVRPKPVTVHAVAMGETNKPDANVVECDNGCLVRKEWITEYHERELKFKETIEADSRIVPEGNLWRVPYKCLNHNADMKKRERLAEAGV